jgi:electron transport complex protein RnfE
MDKTKDRPLSGTVGEVKTTFIDTLFTKNIVLVQAIGISPILAAGVTLKNGVVLTLCTAAVLIPASLFMSLLGERLPAWVRAPIYTVGAAAIMLAAAVFIDRIISHELYAALYVFLPLTAVNTLVSYRAGGFSMSQKPVVALTDAVVSSLGFGLVICIVSGLREIAAYGTLWEKPLNFSVVLSEAALPYAAFLLLGFMAAFLHWLNSVIDKRRGGPEI